MGKTISESVANLRQAFKNISSSARRAESKFKEEGRAFIFARDTEVQRKSHPYVEDACDLFSSLAETYSTDHQLDNILTEVQTESDAEYQKKQLEIISQQYNLLKDDRTVNSIRLLRGETVPYFWQDESSVEGPLRTINDEVRLINSKAYQNYKQNGSNNLGEQPRKTSEAEKRSTVTRQLNMRTHTYDDNYTHYDYEEKHIDLLSPTDAFTAGIKLGKIPAIVLTVITVVIVLSVYIFRDFFDQPAMLWLTHPVHMLVEHQFFIGTMISTLIQRIFFFIPDWVFMIIDNLYAMLGSFISLFTVPMIPVVMTLINRLLIALAGFVIVLVVDLFLIIAMPFCAIYNFLQEKKCARAKRKQSDLIKKQREEKIEQYIEEWNERERKMISAYNERKEALRDYEQEIQRISRSSKPILTSLLKSLDDIEENLNVINSELKDIEHLTNT